MYVVHPAKCIYLANPRTGSTTVRKHLEDERMWKPGEVEVMFDGVSPGTKDDSGHKWGKHHGIDPKSMEKLRNNGYETVCVVRNPWDHIVSWYNIRTRAPSFKKFVENLDEEVFYTLPKQFPNTVQVHLHWSDIIVDFDGFPSKLRKIFGRGQLGHHNSSSKRRGVHYRDFYEEHPHLIDIVAERCATEIELMGFEF